MNTTTTSAMLRSTTKASNPFARGVMLAGKRIEHWKAASPTDDIALVKPLHWTKPRHIILSGDLFAENVSDEAIDRVFAVMALAPQHTFQVLTKRAERMREYVVGAGARPTEAAFALARNITARPDRVDDRNWDYYPARLKWPLPNVWLGVSVEDQARADERIPLLLDTPAAVRFISAEPLLGPVVIPIGGRCRGCGHINLRDGLACEGCGGHHFADRLDWVITGGESGNGARGACRQWYRSIRDQCQAAGVAYFHKQNGEWIDADEWHQIVRSGPDRRLLFDEGGEWCPEKPVDYDDAKWLAAITGDYELEHHSDGSTLIRVGKKAAGRLLDGRTHDEMPA